MSLTTAQSASHFMAFATQSALLTAASTNFRYLPAKAGGLALDRQSKASDELYGLEQRNMRSGIQSAGGSLPLLLYFNQVGLLFGNIFKRTTTEVSSYTVSNSNNQLVFDEGGGDLTATVANGSYTASGLATAIKTAMDSAGSTFTISYSTSTKKYTLAQTTPATFNLHCTNTTNAIWSLIGFSTSANKTGSTSYAADTAAPAVYSHVFTPDTTGQWDTNQQFGLTVLDHRDLFTYQGLGQMLTGLTLAYPEGDPHAPMLTPQFKGADLERIAAVTPTFSTDGAATPYSDPPGVSAGKVSLTVIADGNTYSGQYFKTLQLQITNAVDGRYSVGYSAPVKMVRTGKMTYVLTFAWDLEGGTNTLSEDFETAWRALDDTASVTLTHTGATLRGAYTESLTIAMPAMRPTGSTSQAAAGTVEQPYQLAGQYDTSGAQAGITITLVSKEYLG